MLTTLSFFENYVIQECHSHLRTYSLIRSSEVSG
nr:MAG TPA: hypothetical protein [Caudoviricetes sp.]